MAARFHQLCRTAGSNLSRHRIAWILGALTIVGSALAAEKQAATIPQVRLLYGTRRVQIDVPTRRPKEPAVEPKESIESIDSLLIPNQPAPVPSGTVVAPNRSIQSPKRSILTPARPSLPIDLDDEPAAEPFDDTGVGRWTPAPPAEPADDDLASDDENAAAADDGGEDPAVDTATVAPQTVPPIATQDDADKPGLTTKEAVPPPLAELRLGAEDRINPAAKTPSIELQKSRQPTPADPVDKSTPDSWWLLTAGAQALGTMAGVIVGLACSLALALVVLRRQAAQPAPIVRVELIQTPSSTDQGASLRWQATCTPSPSVSDRELTVVDFADVNIPIPPPSSTWHDRQESQRQEREQAEQSILKTIFEQNVALRTHISQLSKTA